MPQGCDWDWQEKLKIFLEERSGARAWSSHCAGSGGGQLRGRRWRGGTAGLPAGRAGAAFPAGGGPGSWPGARCPAGVDIISKCGRGPGLGNSRAAFRQTHTGLGFGACGPPSCGEDLRLRKQQPRVGSSPDNHGAGLQSLRSPSCGEDLRLRKQQPRVGSSPDNHTGSDRLLLFPLSPRALDSRAETAAGGLVPAPGPALSSSALAGVAASVSCSPAPKVQVLPLRPPHSGAICPDVSQHGNTPKASRPAPSYSHRICGFSVVLFTWVF